MKRLMLWTVLIVAFSISVGGCSETDSTEQEVRGSTVEAQEEAGEGEHLAKTEEPLHVFTTIFALEDFIQKIGGEHVEVTNIIPAGVDAHTFEPDARTLVGIAEGDAFIFSGAGMEGFADQAAEVLQDEDVKITKASEGIELIQSAAGHHHTHEHGDGDHDHSHEHGAEDHDHSHDHGAEDHHDHEQEEHSHDDLHLDHHHGDQDPHVFIDPIRSIQLAENIKQTLVELRPEAADEFEENFHQLEEDLKAVDQEFQEVVDQAEKDTILVSHAGYTYWEDRYGINQVAVTGFSPTNEPTQQQLQQIFHYVEDHGISHLIFERNYSIQIAEMVMEETGVEPLYFHNLENVREEERENKEDYFSLMRQNIDTVREALR
jgi:zinc transport system substrate-binding protein